MKKYVFGLILLCLTSAVFAKQIKYKDFIIDKTESEIKIVKYLGNDSEITLFKSLSKIPVTAICSQAFMNNKTLESITIPTSCKEIGSEAFANCTSLKSVKLYGSEIDIAQNAFQNCNTFTISIIKIPVKKNDSDMTLSSSASAPEVVNVSNAVHTTHNRNPVDDSIVRTFEAKRSSCYSAANQLTMKLEAAVSNFFLLGNENFLAEFFILSAAFTSNQEDFDNYVISCFGENEFSDHTYMDIWYPADELDKYFAVLKRFDKAYLSLMGEDLKTELSLREKYNCK